MPCYLVIDGKKQAMDEDIFDKMVEALHPKPVQEPPIQRSTKWKPDGTFDSKPLDPEYFSKRSYGYQRGINPSTLIF